MRTSLGIVGLISLLGLTEPSRAPLAPPDWYEAHVASVVADCGVWIADNAAYRSDQEPMDAYVIRWQRGVAPGTMRGVANGRHTPTIFEFRTYWHLGTKRGTTAKQRHVEALTGLRRTAVSFAQNSPGTTGRTYVWVREVAR